MRYLLFYRFRDTTITCVHEVFMQVADKGLWVKLFSNQFAKILASIRRLVPPCLSNRVRPENQ
jgi:hypothetical protein